MKKRKGAKHERIRHKNCSQMNHFTSVLVWVNKPHNGSLSERSFCPPSFAVSSQRGGNSSKKIMRESFCCSLARFLFVYYGCLRCCSIFSLSFFVLFLISHFLIALMFRFGYFMHHLVCTVWNVDFSVSKAPCCSLLFPFNSLSLIFLVRVLRRRRKNGEEEYEKVFLRR